MRRLLKNNRTLATGLLLIGLSIAAGTAVLARRVSRQEVPLPTPSVPETATSNPDHLRFSAEQQKAVNIETIRAERHAVADILHAPGRVTPDESHYAFVTPRAAGVVREVRARIGQEVRQGEVLAVIDSPEVAQARLDLVTKRQSHEVAQTEATWEQALYHGTLELIERLQAGDSPEAIHNRFSGRPLGELRERLITAYANFRLADATMKRNRELQREGAVSLTQYQQVLAEFESAQAIFQSLMDRANYEATLAYIRSQNALRQSETATNVARERLRVLGVEAPERPAKPLPDQKTVTLEGAVQAAKSLEAASPGEGMPVSTYELIAPFDGTILDRGVVVPGVAVTPTHQLFTMANLSRVWVEANVHEHDFAKLGGSRGGHVTIRSRAYPDRAFEGQVLYTGDLVDEQSHMVKLLAGAENPGRSLKPGMFVDVEITSQAGSTAVRVPESALVSEDEETFVFVKTGPESFERRSVSVGGHEHGHVTILRGLTEGEEVVTRGAFKLKAEAIRLAHL